MTTTALALYQKFFVQKGTERLALFEVLAERYDVKSVLYPGSFVHITPSLVFPRVVYVDNDRRCPRFFADPAVATFISEHRLVKDAGQVSFLAQDFTKPLDLPDASIDLLLSQWTTPTSNACKRYLRVGGLLVANDSHGDASLASLDPDYECVAVVTESERGYALGEKDLDAYFVPKSGREVSRQDIETSGRGATYTLVPAMYVFRRTA